MTEGWTSLQTLLTILGPLLAVLEISRQWEVSGGAALHAVTDCPRTAS